MGDQIKVPFVGIPEQVFYDRRLECSDKMVYGTLCSFSFAKNTKRVHPDREVLAFNAGVSYKTATRSLERLEEFGYIKTEQRHRQATTIILLDLEETTNRLVRTRSQMEFIQSLEEDLSVTNTDSCRSQMPTVNNRSLTLTPQQESIAESDEEIEDNAGKRKTFEKFWREYPKGRGSRKKALEYWLKMTPQEHAVAIKKVRAWKQTRQWREGYIKYAERFLQNRTWEDDVPEDNIIQAAPRFLTQADHNRGGQGRLVQ